VGASSASGKASIKPVARCASKDSKADGSDGTEPKADGSKKGGASSKSSGSKVEGGGKVDNTKKEKVDGGGGGSSSSSSKKSSKAKVKLTPQHLYVAYVWYLKQRENNGEGLVPGEEESFCIKCKDGGDVLLCDYTGCTKSYHLHCCQLKAVPEGIWECPRHRCVQCGCGPSQTDAHGKPRKPQKAGEVGYTLWPCRTCPTTYCERCLPQEVTFASAEIVCQSCQELLSADMTSLQRDLIKWKPELFAAATSTDS